MLGKRGHLAWLNRLCTLSTDISPPTFPRSLWTVGELPQTMIWTCSCTRWKSGYMAWQSLRYLQNKIHFLVNSVAISTLCCSFLPDLAGSFAWCSFSVWFTPEHGNCLDSNMGSSINSGSWLLFFEKFNVSLARGTSMSLLSLAQWNNRREPWLEANEPFWIIFDASFMPAASRGITFTL